MFYTLLSYYFTHDIYSLPLLPPSIQHRAPSPKITQHGIAFEGERMVSKVDTPDRKGASTEHLEGDETEGDGKGVCVVAEDDSAVVIN